jgi:hypothetical protein
VLKIGTVSFRNAMNGYCECYECYIWVLCVLSVLQLGIMHARTAMNGYCGF